MCHAIPPGRRRSCQSEPRSSERSGSCAVDGVRRRRPASSSARRCTTSARASTAHARRARRSRSVCRRPVEPGCRCGRLVAAPRARAPVGPRRAPIAPGSRGRDVLRRPSDRGRCRARFAASRIAPPRIAPSHRRRTPRLHAAVGARARRVPGRPCAPRGPRCAAPPPARPLQPASAGEHGWARPRPDRDEPRTAPRRGTRFCENLGCLCA
jgi:hypothetical protein